MALQDFYLTIFQMSVVCFVMGGIFPFVFNRYQQLANTIANACTFFGGVLTTALSMKVLRSGVPIDIDGWRIVGSIGMNFHFDALSAFFLLVIGVMSTIIPFYAFGYAQKYFKSKRAGWLGGLVNIFILSLVGVVGVDNSLTFMIFWEFMALTSFLLVMFDHEQAKVRSGGYMYVVMTHIGSVFLTFSFLTLYYYTGSVNFADYHQIGESLPSFTKNAIFVMCLLGFGTKMGVFPLQVWLPRAYPVTPSSAVALMSSAMIKTAVYALIRVTFDFLGTGPSWWGVLMMMIGAITAIFCILLAVIQNDMKRFLAYSSAENLGIIFVGVGATLFFQSQEQMLLAALAMLASLYHVLNHSVFKALMFMGAGAVAEKAGTCNVNQLGGLIHRMPWTSAFVLIGGMSLASLPPFCGFISEWGLLQSLLHMVFDSTGAWVKLFASIVIAILGLSGAFCVVAVVKNFGMGFLAKPRSKSAAEAKEVGVGMRVGMGLLAGISLFLGMFPGIVLPIINAVVHTYFNDLVLGWQMVLFIPFKDDHFQVLSIGLLGIAVITIIALIMLALVIKYGKSEYEIEDTWNCGTIHQVQMQYTGTSFSHPILLIYKRIMGLTRQVEIDQVYEYYPKKIGHQLDISARLADNVYKPSVGILVKVFKKIKMIQNGNLQAYLSYMVAALIITLLWIG
ncbi:proton-conducting transporter transmembrane domain-containing protein [Anaerosinus sp.]